MKLTVTNKILQYKSEVFQISQITSIEKKRFKLNNRQIPPSMGTLIYSIPICVISILIFSQVPGLNSQIYMLFFVTILVSGLYSFYRVKMRLDFSSDDRYMNQVAIKLSNGEMRIFESSIADRIEDVHEAILAVMNGEERATITFENVQIDISDSENTTIGAIG